IVNSRMVLASPETATDAHYVPMEGFIAHEYFHNWTGNRVTCRDWFQLTLKEGLTVFRDQFLLSHSALRLPVRFLSLPLSPISAPHLFLSIPSQQQYSKEFGAMAWAGAAVDGARAGASAIRLAFGMGCRRGEGAEDDARGGKEGTKAEERGQRRTRARAWQQQRYQQGTTSKGGSSEPSFPGTFLISSLLPSPQCTVMFLSTLTLLFFTPPPLCFR
ncbi:unnamed protein product, partial [Closterium sp. Naga37s-1]